jgi:hypothetical protein
MENSEAHNTIFYNFVQEILKLPYSLNNIYYKYKIIELILHEWWSVKAVKFG